MAQTSRLRSILGTLGGVLLGAVLLVAAGAKAINPEGFAEEIRAQGLDLLLPAAQVALIALALEVGLGLALILGVRRLSILVPTALLVAFFLVLTGRTYWLAERGLLDQAPGCGCFGNLLDRTPAEAFWTDLALLVPPLLLALWGRQKRTRKAPRLRLAVAAVAAVGTVVLAWRAPDLPLDDWATRLRPEVRVAELCAGRGEERICLDYVVPELVRGEHLVVLADLADPELGPAVADLNEYSWLPDVPRLWMVSAATPEEYNMFYWQWRPAFEIREAPQALLRPLYRRLPRAFLVEDGRVERTFSGLPPLGQLTSRAEGQVPSLS